MFFKFCHSHLLFNPHPFLRSQSSEIAQAPRLSQHQATNPPTIRSHQSSDDQKHTGKAWHRWKQSGLEVDMYRWSMILMSSLWGWSSQCRRRRWGPWRRGGRESRGWPGCQSSCWSWTPSLKALQRQQLKWVPIPMCSACPHFHQSETSFPDTWATFDWNYL